MAQQKPLQESWYNHPRYYDIAFRGETDHEADFIAAACRKYCPFPARQLLEPACGTGRLVVELAARGYGLTGFDLSAPALAYLRQRLTRRKLQATIYAADMTEFRLPQPVDAAFCTFNSFRLLLSEEAVQRHLQSVADSLRPGGVYILGFHLLPPDADDECIERWTERAGRTQVTVTLRVLDTDRGRRLETIRVSMLVREGGAEKRFRDEFQFRRYTAAQFRRLLARVPSLQLRDVYDFWYDIDEPLKLDNNSADTVFILQKQ